MNADRKKLRPMSDSEFRMYCDLLRSHCGLHFDDSSRFFIERRVGRRVLDLELGSFGAYHFSLRKRGGDEEIAQLVDILTTNETYFFRERSQLSALIDEIVPELVVHRRHSMSPRPVSIWSAGCSSGEEPYSIVALAIEAGLEPARDIRVYASDISRPMLTKSRRGVYRESSFRETSAELREKYFTEKDGLFRICDEIKKHVDLIHLNLMDESKLSLLGAMDVIVCRNVIIYFDSDTKKRVIQSFYDRLNPGGYLLLGHSESLINLSTAFELKHVGRSLVYRRPLPGEELRDSWHDIAEATAASVGGESGVR